MCQCRAVINHKNFLPFHKTVSLFRCQDGTCYRILRFWSNYRFSKEDRSMWFHVIFQMFSMFFGMFKPKGGKKPNPQDSLKHFQGPQPRRPQDVADEESNHRAINNSKSSHSQVSSR